MVRWWRWEPRLALPAHSPLVAGERLPLFIFANWRGFSGGRRDMFEEILKFGSMIVERLVDYDQPGTWAVIGLA